MIVVVGLSYRTAPVEVRERFAGGGDVLPAVLARLATRSELRESLFLSTCNRVEIFASADEPHLAAQAVRDALAEHASIPPEDVASFLYVKHGDEAVRHVFRVASSLDSMVLGEPQILGQVKDAHDAALAAGTLGSYLGRCVNRAFGVAKRVRSETAIGAGTVSISSVAVDLARKIFGDLSGHQVLLVGAGEMAEQAARSLGKHGQTLRVCNRSAERALSFASAHGADAVKWENLEAELVLADVVVTSTSSPGFVITRDLVKRVAKARRGRTLFFIDIAVPRDVDPAVHGLDNVYVYNIDDLEQQVAEGMKLRQSELTAAEQIVAQELEEFETWARGLGVQPTVVALRAKTRAVLLGELERSLGGRLKHLGEAERAALTQMVESAANKLLHAPTSRLKAAAVAGEGADLAQVLQHLFDLPDLKEVPREPAEGADAAARPSSDDVANEDQAPTDIASKAGTRLPR